MQRPRIAFLIPSLETGGAERVVATLSNHLIDFFDVTILVLYKSPIFFDLDPRIQVVFCGDSYKPIYSLKHSFKTHIRLTRKIVSLLKTHNIDLIIGFMTTPNIYAVLASRLVKIPCIISERVHPEYIDTSKFWFKLRRRLYPIADNLIVQTQDIADYFSKFVNPKKIQIILNPLNPSLVEKRDQQVLKENIILNVGRLDYQKNQEMLIKAFANINADNWKLVIVGDGQEKEHYKSLINELNLNGKITLVGNTNNIAEYYNKASLFAFTSRYEGFPNALTEAMFFGLPCIATDCPSGPSELIDDSVNGLLIPSEDQLALEEKLQLLISNPELRSKISIATENNIDKFNVENVSQQWQKIINNLLN
ncbi:hypothetical protein C1T31_08545 [Hanstruepera neustonica]|uniref:Glycosyltransferase family 4 protein n=1 Tax=Hanstruepera neustonica TaxID=1445657 RepID=A0A2K1DYD5_9FLAO|nr:glycosyltransferase family 4 protein [Hanstruepera neustonica]PNQ73033.1 hypothetical protein C1T31_08545 [Hanstruepera neustonica]